MLTVVGEAVADLHNRKRRAKPGDAGAMAIGSMFGRKKGIGLAIAFLVLSASCRDMPTAPTTPSPSNNPSNLLGFPSATPRLLVCPSSQDQSTSALIGLDGGTVSLSGTSVTIPAGALDPSLLTLGPATVQLDIPAGQYMEVVLTVNGQHISFLKPAVVTIDYSRCNRFQTLFHLLSVWYIDDNANLLENMGGFDNKLTQSITFVTPHFSGFAIAY